MKRFTYTVTGGEVTVFQSALYRTNAAVVETEDVMLIVDPTWLPHEIEDIKRHVQARRGERKLLLLVTHSDFDHLIGCGAFPDAAAIGSSPLAVETDKQAKLAQIQAFDAQYYIDRDDPIVYPDIRHAITEDGERLLFGSTVLTFYMAPGHTKCGLFTVVEPAGIWLAGDYLSDFELPLIEHSAAAYENTLLKAFSIVEAHKARLLVPGHGAPTEEPKEMHRRIAMAQSHIDRLRQAVRERDEAALGALGAAHAYPSPFMEEAHELNVRLIREEEEGDGESLAHQVQERS
ncbi:MBL fold metallo-hydrolase [Paenibacillus tarimensis]